MADAFKDVVVVIPGILGSRLVRKEGSRETTVWDLSVKGLPRALLSLVNGDLALSNPDRRPDDKIVATELFKFQLLPGLVGVDDYTPLLQALKKLLPNPLQLISFPYDWRASNRFAAECLKSRALDALAKWKEASNHPQAKLWLVCHSMGGLVARYFCEHLDGAKHTRAIVTFGTPHRGAAKALGALSNGLKFGPIDLSSTVRSLPSVYELLPLYRAVRIPAPPHTLLMHRVADFFGLDGIAGADSLSPAGRGTPATPGSLQPLPGLDRAMLQRALQFHAAIRVPAEQRQRDGVASPYRQLPLFNRRQPTLLSARLAGPVLEMLDTYPEPRQGAIVDEASGGDGTVPSFSAMPIEWDDDSSQGVPLTDMHAAIQCAEVGLETLLNWLQPVDLHGKKGIRGSVDADLQAVSLASPTAVALGEPLVLTLAAIGLMPVTVTLQSAEGGGAKGTKLLLPGKDVARTVQFKPTAPGAFRVSVQPDDHLRPAVSDWVYVFDK